MKLNKEKYRGFREFENNSQVPLPSFTEISEESEDLYSERTQLY